METLVIIITVIGELTKAKTILEKTKKNRKVGYLFRFPIFFYKFSGKVSKSNNTKVQLKRKIQGKYTHTNLFFKSPTHRSLTQ